MSEETIVDTASARATLSRVAAEAAVSTSTVSKVLNGRTGVSETTRIRIEELLAVHGYNRRGGGQTAALIELVFSRLDNLWAIEIIRGVEAVARENGMSVILTESGDRHSPAPDWIEGVVQRRPAGVILVFSDLSPDHKRQLRTRNIPFVVVDPAGDPAPDVPSIGSANWSGGVLATRHLIDLGHRNIAMITGPDDMMCSRARVSGYRSALDAAGIPIQDHLIVPGQFHREDGIERGQELLSLPNPPTAVFAGSDLTALGVYEAARSVGVEIPRDLSVVGYDDLQIAQWAGPPLTTVKQPLSEMAAQATRLVLRLRNGREVESLRIDLATSLVVRNSTARPA
ncbi:LacI family DNA-binding transcriptional regulator [Arthrobacter sp. MI7-26]|uniref:LacI family DNA-binding transcriptional regulator n=1 Tax=Arthrobacter sp. MI7-26 TaxID=2993653 RepID=UPI002249362E|nr:LacI family DNA-binding transcriptional regulator [Arthrobacter sp. MI7-26]MCX2750072.1 LacI family DNA-binding transcriptional regulator [Arthrobacter sp. MI7-26]